MTSAERILWKISKQNILSYKPNPEQSIHPLVETYEWEIDQPSCEPIGMSKQKKNWNAIIKKKAKQQQKEI